MNQAERDDLNKRIAEEMGWTGNDIDGWFAPREYRELVSGCRYPNFITDPAMALLLMGKILGTGRDLTINTSGENLVNLSSDYIELKDVIRIQFKPIGEAVALAYVAMRGLR